MIGVGVYLMLVGALGGALGWIVRSTAGGITSLVAILLVLPVLVGLLPNSVSDHVTKFLPSEAGGAFVTTHPDAHSLAPWTGLGAFICTLLSLAWPDPVLRIFYRHCGAAGG